MSAFYFRLTLMFLQDAEEFFWKNTIDLVRILESIVSIVSLQIIQINVVAVLVTWRMAVLRHRAMRLFASEAEKYMAKAKEDTDVH